LLAGLFRGYLNLKNVNGLKTPPSPQMKNKIKSKGVFGKEIKTFFYEIVLIFYLKWGEWWALSPLRPEASTQAKIQNSENDKVIKICFYHKLSGITYEKWLKAKVTLLRRLTRFNTVSENVRHIKVIVPTNFFPHGSWGR
jgi:hypothetical protein